jgi:hypothetical protein
MSKMDFHNLFGDLKCKLWLKEGSGVKLPIWLLRIKSQELPRFTCLQVACHILLEIFWWRQKLCFKPHFNWRSLHKVMGLQSRKSPNDIWVLAPWPYTKYTIRGKVVAFPKSGSRWILWVHVCLWFVCAPKMFQLHTNQLVVWFVQVHVSNWFAYHSS